VSQQRFVLLAAQRTGSNMLVSVLDSHPQVRCHGELLRKRSNAREGEVGVARQLADRRFRDHAYRQRRPLAFLKAVFALDPEPPFIGFKLMLSQSRRLRRRLIADESVRKVLLFRENLLAAHSSDLIAAATGQGTAAVGQPLQRAQVAFSPDAFEDFRQRRSRNESRLREELRASGQTFLELEYLDATTRDGQLRALEFIGADTALPFEAGTQKRNPSDILARFSNPETVAAHLASIGLERWAREAQSPPSI